MTEKDKSQTLQASKLIPRHVYSELTLTKAAKEQFSSNPPSNIADKQPH
jgi:hypothetical protein